MIYNQRVQSFMHRLDALPFAQGAKDTSTKVKRIFGRAVERLYQTFSNNLAVDLGTSNTVLYAPGHGVVLNEPSVIAFNNDTNEIVAIGRQAKLALGRQASTIRIVRPLKDGVIADFDATELMLSYFIKSAISQRKLSNPRVLICAPGEVSQVERRALEDAAGRAGAKYVEVIEEPIAAAVGAGFDIQSGKVFMLVDIGGGTTDIAVLGYGGPVHLSTLRVGGNKMDEAIIQHMRHDHYLEIGELAAEAMKLEIGSAKPKGAGEMVEVRGRNLKAGLPAVMQIPFEEVRSAVEPIIQEVIKGVRNSLEELPPEVSTGLLESGIVLTGGASQLAGLADRISRETGLEARLAPDVLSVAALGAGKLVQEKNHSSVRELMTHCREEKSGDSDRNHWPEQ